MVHFGERNRLSQCACALLLSLQIANGQSLVTSTAAQAERSGMTEQARHRLSGVLFEESVLADNSDYVINRSIELSSQSRYEFLANWVLPSQSHDAVRLTAGFAADTAREDQRRATDNLVSPAFELIVAAGESGRLAELRTRVARISSQSESQQRARLSLLTLIDIAGEDLTAASDSMNDLYERHRRLAFASLQDRWPETLVVAEAIHHAQLREPTEEILLRMLQEQVRPGKKNGPDPWDRLIPSLLGQLRLEEGVERVGTTFGNAPKMRDWFPVSAKDFGTHGLGFPAAHWNWDEKSVQLLSHHNNDYLYFRSPLTGNFDIECEATGFGYREAHLLVAGTWIWPAVAHDAYFAGRVGSDLPIGKISPRLSEITDWMRLQARVRDNRCSFYVDGRLVHEETLPAGRDPWLAIRVPFSTYGRVRDLCITGTPVIPETLRLSDNSELHGWSSYYGGGLGDRRYHDWWHDTDESGTGTIVGLSTASRSGTAKESLLQYQRPVIEDGDLDYEFFFDPGKSHVHPALGREVLLLNPEGVSIHQITDAHFDRTGADPLIQRFPEAVDSDVRPLLLRAGEWNHANLRIRDDSLELRMNGQLVYRGAIAATRNERTFGLFHYEGDTEIRVRNVEWRGDWPKKLPALHDQELRDKTAEELDAVLPQLTAEFSHDFTRSGLPLNLFQIQDQGADKYVEAKDDGLHVNAEMNGTGYSRVCVTPLLVVEGDFDMSAAFDGLRINPTEHGQCNAMLQMAFTDVPISHHAASMTTTIDPGRFPQQIVNHELLQLKPFHQGLLDKRSEAVTSGRLRLARRGDKIYSMFAPEDSKVFRLVHADDCATQPSRFDGARLVAGMNSSVDGISKVSIIWKSLNIRAARLTGPAIDTEPHSGNKRKR